MHLGRNPANLNNIQENKRLIEITQNESKLIRQNFPGVHISIVNRHKKGKRKRYYMEEAKAALIFIRKLRNTDKAGRR